MAPPDPAPDPRPARQSPFSPSALTAVPLPVSHNPAATAVSGMARCGAFRRRTQSARPRGTGPWRGQTARSPENPDLLASGKGRHLIHPGSRRPSAGSACRHRSGVADRSSGMAQLGCRTSDPTLGGSGQSALALRSVSLRWWGPGDGRLDPRCHSILRRQPAIALLCWMLR